MRRLTLLVGLLLVAAAGLGFPGAAPSARSTAAHWEIRDLGVLGGTKSEALAISERGQVVGYALAAGGASHAFVWYQGKMRDLGPGYAVGINDRGQVVGYKDVGSNRAALLWENGKARALPSSGKCPSSMAVAINGSGRIVGWGGEKENCSLSMSLVPYGLLWVNGRQIRLAGWAEGVAINEPGHVVVNVQDRQALLWRADKKTALGSLAGRFGTSHAASINAHDQVVGSSDTGKGTVHAFLWQKRKMRDLGTLPGGRASVIMGVTRVGDMNFSNYYPHAINERGQAVGCSETAGGASHPFLWEQGKMVDLGTLAGAKYCGQPAISEAGQIVGTVSRSSGSTTVERAFVWQHGTMIDLGTLGGASSFAAAINDHGQIVGSSQTKSGQTHAVLWTLKPGS